MLHNSNMIDRINAVGNEKIAPGVLCLDTKG